MRLCIAAALFAALLVGPLGLTCCLAEDAESPPASDASPSESPSPSDSPPTADGAADLDAIRAASQSFVAAFNAADAKAVADHWTESGDYTDDYGRNFAGRDAIEAGYAAFFAENEANHQKAQMRMVIDSLRLLSDAAAIEDGRAMVDPTPTGPPAIARYTAVHVKVDGKWLLATVRDTHVETPSGYQNVEDLEWLIGVWTAEEHGAKTESVCRWVANKSFVERKYTTTQPDGAETSGVQLIGFNPQTGQVQSWNFSSDGGHAVGAWTPREGGWSAEIHGVLADGANTSAVNLLTRLDDNAYVWQSTQRTLGDQSLPDTGEVIMKRQPRK